MKQVLRHVLHYGLLLLFVGCSLALLWRWRVETWGPVKWDNFWSPGHVDYPVFTHHQVPEIFLARGHIYIVSQDKKRDFILRTFGRSTRERDDLERSMITITEEMVGKQIVAIPTTGFSPGLVLAWFLSLQGFLLLLVFRKGAAGGKSPTALPASD